MKHLERAFDFQNQWWKYSTVINFGFIAAPAFGSLPLYFIFALRSRRSDNYAKNAFDFEAYGLDPNIGLILIVLPFIVGLIATILLIKTLHKRNIKEVINGSKRIRWNRMFFAFFIWMILLLAGLIINYLLDPGNFTITFNIASFIPLVFIALIFIPFQASFEEVFFRGYIAQGIARLSKSRWAVLIIVSLVFALLHSANPEIEEYGFWVLMPQYLLSGLLMGLISILDDGIETAIGLHIAHNVFVSIFLNFEASVIQTNALFEIKSLNPVLDIFLVIMYGTVFVLILAKKYKWKFSTLNRKFAEDQESIYRVF